MYGIDLNTDPDGLPDGAVGFRQGRGDRSMGDDAKGHICVDPARTWMSSEEPIGLVYVWMILYIAGLSPVHYGDRDKRNFK